MTLSVSEITARNRQIVDRFEAGETMQAIGKSLGLTRERVRQILRTLGSEPTRSRKKRQRADIVAAVAAEKLSSAQASERFGVSRTTIWKTCHDAGIRTFVPHVYDAPEYAAMAELVRGGMSVRKAAGADRKIVERLMGYCHANGIPTNRNGRWRDLSHRAEIVSSLRAAGKSWRVVAQVVGAAEGRSALSEQTIYLWAKRNAPHLVGAEPRARSERKPRPSRTFQIIWAETAKEAARLNYGKAPASVIAAAHGVTRNSIIGHWNRLRQAGLLPPERHPETV